MTGLISRTSSTRLLSAAYLLLLSSGLVIVTGAILPSRPLRKPAELSLNGLQSPNVSSLGNSSPKCTRSPRWIEPPYRNERCFEALNTLYEDYAHRFGTTEFEFIAPGAIPTHEPLVPVTTPKKWNTGMLIMVHALSAAKQNMYKHTKTAE